VRPPPETLVVDAAILVAAVLGRSGPLLSEVGRRVVLITTDRATREASRRVELGVARPDLLPALNELLRAIRVVAVERLTPRLATAETALRDAVPSRNGSTSDAHLLALAWETDAEIWTHDRDFAGVGVASWSTINLIAALDDA
jgi:predicted nucleic acid-binding protein